MVLDVCLGQSNGTWSAHGQAAWCAEGTGIVHGAVLGCKERAWGSPEAQAGCLG